MGKWEFSEAKTFSREKVARQSRDGCGAVPGRKPYRPSSAAAPFHEGKVRDSAWQPQKILDKPPFLV